MPDYRIYCLDGAGKIVSAEWLDAQSDDEAIAILRAQSREVDCEVWEGRRLVGRIRGYRRTA